MNGASPVSDTFPDRFWAKVDVRGPDECWLWVGTKTSCGYGMACRHLRRVYAHRLSWILHHGAIPDGLCVLHKCDVRPCVNPKHLFLGTQIDNIHDAMQKRRHCHGERVKQARLSIGQVREIVVALASGETQASIARRFCIVPSAINAIAHGKRWVAALAATA